MSLSSVVGKISPVLGSILNAFVPGSSLVLNAIENVFGLPSGSSDDTIAAAIQADPDASIKLKQIEADHEAAIMDMQTKIRLGAYAREEIIVESTHKRDWVLDVLAIGTVSGFFLVSALIFFIHIDQSMTGIVNFVCGEISSLAAIVISYYFGATFKQQMSNSASRPVTLPPPAQTR